jgi:hypothetical protein
VNCYLGAGTLLAQSRARQDKTSRVLCRHTPISTNGAQMLVRCPSSASTGISSSVSTSGKAESRTELLPLRRKARPQPPAKYMGDGVLVYFGYARSVPHLWRLATAGWSNPSDNAQGLD